MYAHANLFRTLCTNFYQNRQSFVDDMTNILAYFFSWTRCICMFTRIL